MKKFNSLEELDQERKELFSKFEGDVPNYLVDLFDKRRKEIETGNSIRDFYIRRKQFSGEEISAYIKKRDKEFWENNDLEIVKELRPVAEEYKYKFDEPIRNPLDEKERSLSPEEIRVLVRLCEKDLYLFAIRYFPHYLKIPSSRLHRFLYGTLQRETNKYPNGVKWAIAAPRANSKSTIISNIFPLWCVCYNKKRFIIILSDTLGQAEDFLFDIKYELELNEKMKRDFPNVVGKGSVWRTNEIITNNNVKILTLGTGQKIRGRRFGIHRPDLIVCHEEGTQIFFDGQWKNISEHPTAQKKSSDGVEVSIYGVPFSEVVTKEHEYFIKSIKFKKKIDDSLVEYSPKFKEAQELQLNDFIGYKIDYTVNDPQPIDIYCPKISERDAKGRIIRSLSSYERKTIKEFYDEEFWWMVGLWWGDGYSDGIHKLNISFNLKEVNKINKLIEFLKKYNRSFYIDERKNSNYVQIIFCWSEIARWLKSWRMGNSKKKPPYWVECLPLNFQKQIILGYIDSDGFIDYKLKNIRITSVYLEGLLSVRRILSRLGVPSYIRNGIESKEYNINGRTGISSKKYDIRFSQNIKEVLGINIENQQRYSYTKVHIKNGYIWSKIKKLRDVKDKIFVPITTESHTYLTHFGVSHNCDDLENSEMVKSEVQRHFIRYEWFNKEVIFVGGEEGSSTDFFVVGTSVGKEALLNALLDPEQYPEWKNARWAAVTKYHDPESDELWEKWKQIYKDRFNTSRKDDAKKFFEEHKEEMLKGSEVLWPEGDPYYNLMEYKMSNPSGFATEKQNEPIDITKIYVSEEDLTFEYFNQNEKIRECIDRGIKHGLIFGSLDPSLGKKSHKGDYSCIVTMVRDLKTGLIFVMDINLKRRTVEAQIQDILDFHLKHKYKLFAVETNAFQYVVAENLRKLSKETGVYVPLQEIINYQDKKMRFEGIVPFLKDGTIVFDKEKKSSNNMYALGISQICTFTGEGDEEDDCPDALEMCFRIAKAPAFHMLVKPTKRIRR